MHLFTIPSPDTQKIWMFGLNTLLKMRKKVWQALKEFGAPLVDVSEKDFPNPEIVYQIGVEPNRIDIMMDIPGVKKVDSIEEVEFQEREIVTENRH